ncbi:MAG: hypothetical protein HFJ46_02780 [Clostridia bacterium]|jgi:DNA-directed RNA polymerase specialized sigma24 family protein|nr:hypothetical protein [Clostridia bacterium]
MEKSDIRKVLRSPSKELVELALGYVNLTEKEKQVIKYVEMEGKTEERTAEILDISTRNLQNIKAEAFKKLDFVWSYNLFISMLLRA